MERGYSSTNWISTPSWCYPGTISNSIVSRAVRSPTSSHSNVYSFWYERARALDPHSLAVSRERAGEAGERGARSETTERGWARTRIRRLRVSRLRPSATSTRTRSPVDTHRLRVIITSIKLVGPSYRYGGVEDYLVLLEGDFVPLIPTWWWWRTTRRRVDPTWSWSNYTHRRVDPTWYSLVDYQ